MQYALRSAVLAIGLLAFVTGARGNGVAVLDSIEGARADLDAAVQAAGDRVSEIDVLISAGGLEREAARSIRKERKTLVKAVKAAGKVAPILERAASDLRDHEMPAFLKSARKVGAAWLRAEKSFGPAYLPVARAEELSGVLAQTLTEASALVDAGDPGAREALERADALAADGDAQGEKGRPQKAAAKYLAGMGALMDLPLRVAGGHPSIRYRALNGAPLNLAMGVAPYSPRRTCGECHDYAHITEGYHFDQGRRDVSDTYAVGKPIPPYVLSDGMYGRW